MEASKFGFGPDTPPAFKFDPTDADIVAGYLLPRALGLPNPYAHAIIEDDPASAPPWELLRRHYGSGRVDHAFFFGPPANGRRKSRTIKGAGVWQGQKGSQGTVTLLRPGGGELDVTYKRYDLTFCRAKHGGSTGYVMHEYEIISPPLPGTVLSRVNINKHPKKKRAAAGERPGTSYQYDASAMPSDSSGFSFSDAQAGALCGGNGGGMPDAGCYYARLKYAFPEDCCLPATDQPGASYNAAAMNSDGQGFAGAQVDAFSGGGMVDTDAAYNNYYGQYQEVAPWSCQLGQSHNHGQYLSGDAAVMRSHGEGFSVQQPAGALSCYVENAALMCSGGEQQAGALCGYNNTGSVMPTEGASSTISLRDGGENGDKINDVLFGNHDGEFNREMSDQEIYDVLFGDNYDGHVNCEQSDAGDAATNPE
ncbi:hypothetical protein CFC21_034403 [Triticum aestivum]|uniref:NAC domain-containing protein n=2 Tax=Triticum aestivum TaxID=4565 RepID=A0A3B6EE13_WHEAT|nr:NAC transcription factor ONAC010-like [Triticum aestivum]KAF7021453.1 hypothetical protein CFC21_034403 [Triticum aestivum]